MRAGAVFVAIAASAGPVYAQSSTGAAREASGAAVLARARAAWDKGDFDLAPSLYQSAIDAGGLPRPDVVDAYVHIGSALAIAGKKKPASIAFKRAALLDPGFKMPPEAGRKASAIADKARREQVRAGSLTIVAQVPDEVESGAPFGVDVTMAPAQSVVAGRIVDSVAFIARDSLSGRAFEQTSPPGSKLHFDVPTRMTLPQATIVVRVEARDAHNNQLASVEKRAHVAKAQIVSASPAPLLASNDAPPPSRSHDRASPRSSAGFWSSPWPYILGGAALAAGGAAVWYATRPTDDVTVGSVRVQLSR